MMTYSKYNALYTSRFESFSQATFAELKSQARAHKLHSAMAYSMFNGGKRVRPFLVYAIGEMLGATLTNLDAPAFAIECIHTYSLIHDDLPAMDNDSLRRGQPTCHIQFDEATAILAGDALQTLAFETLTQHPYEQLPSSQQLALVRYLAQASGLLGMCGGQALDIAADTQTPSLVQLQNIHQLKTGALILAAVNMGAACAPEEMTDTTRDLLQSWANTLGLMFQVQDDILDVTSDTETLGKPQGSDSMNQKATYPALMGLEGAIQKRDLLAQQALQALSGIPYNTQTIEDFTHYLVARER